MSKTVLVADDERTLNLVATTLEQDPRYRLLRAQDRVGALALARRERPLLLLLDVIMPCMDGYEVCLRLKSDPETAAIPIVMFTVLNDEETRHGVRHAGVDDLITKPFSPTALLLKVEQVLSRAAMPDAS